MKEKAKQLLTESSKIDVLTLLFDAEVVNEISVRTGSGSDRIRTPLSHVSE